MRCEQHLTGLVNATFNYIAQIYMLIQVGLQQITLYSIIDFILNNIDLKKGCDIQIQNNCTLTNVNQSSQNFTCMFFWLIGRAR